MKLLKQITSAMLSMTIIAGAAATGLSIKTDTSAASTKLMYNTVISQWKTRINDEKNNRFPNKAYWNHKGVTKYDENTCTNKPCNHKPDEVKGLCYCSEVLFNGNYSKQCYGFAIKLAKDIWGTKEFYTYDIGSNYEPKIGDNVRLNIPVDNISGKTQGHSIFITGISGENITFAECNGELEDCQIRWDRTSYYEKVHANKVYLPDKDGVNQEATIYKGVKSSITTVNKSYLRKYGISYKRPVIAGDLNKNDRLDSGDAEIFEQTVMKDGRTSNSNHTPLSYYDVNGDGYVDMSDYNEIRYGSNNYRIITPDEDPTCRWNSRPHDSGFLFNDGCYYVKNKFGGASWIGMLDTDKSSVYVSSRVYDPNDNCWYNVNEIGAERRSGQSGDRTCTRGCKIKTLYIPDSITRIHSYTFEEGKLTSLRFSGSNPQLETIDEYAFYNCKTLKTLDLTPAKKLKNIGNNAFEGCTGLYHIDLPYTTHVLNLGSGSGSIFGSTNPTSATIEINNPYTSTSPSSNYQKINIAGKDYNYWKNNDLYFYGRIFKLYNQNKYIGKVDRYQGYLRP